MWRLVPALVRQMGAAYPELVRAEALITETLQLEETSFKQTLDRGLQLLDEETAQLGAGAGLPRRDRLQALRHLRLPARPHPGRAARAAAARSRSMRFNAAMERQRAEARKSWVGSGEAATEQVWFELREEVGATEFLGYETRCRRGQIVAIVVDGKAVDAAKAGERGRHHRQPDAVLRRIGRPDGRHRHDVLGRRRRVRRARHAKARRRALRPSRHA